MPPGTLGKHPGALYFFMTSTTASFPLAKSSAFPCFFGMLVKRVLVMFVSPGTGECDANPTSLGATFRSGGKIEGLKHWGIRREPENWTESNLIEYNKNCEARLAWDPVVDSTKQQFKRYKGFKWQETHKIHLSLLACPRIDSFIARPTAESNNHPPHPTLEPVYPFEQRLCHQETVHRRILLHCDLVFAIRERIKPSCKAHKSAGSNLIIQAKGTKKLPDHSWVQLSSQMCIEYCRAIL